MALVLKNRVKETTTSTGVGDITLNGAQTGYQAFSSIGDQNETYYVIKGSTEWEVGRGRYYTVGGYSNFFDSSDNIVVPGSSVFNFGSNSFTLECWIYPASIGAITQCILDAWNNAPTRFLLRINSGVLQFYANPGSSININYTLPAANQWYHVACVRNGTNFRLYVDGVSRGTPITNAGTIAANTNSWTISRSGETYGGLISDVRIVNGTAVYTNDFTPPTTPLEPIANTSLLTCQSSQFEDNSINRFNLTVTGATISSNTPYSGSVNRLARLTTLNTSNSGSLVEFSAGTKDVMCVYSTASMPGGVPTFDNLEVTSDLSGWRLFQSSLMSGVDGGAVFNNSNVGGIISTYSLVYTTSTGAYRGGVLAPNGDIYFVPDNAIRGQKISSGGVVSTYALVYTTTSAYAGGVLSPNGDIHFVPYTATRGQKVNSSGVVSTYSLVYTTSSGAFYGGVLAPNGDVHFVPYTSSVGQKVSVDGVVSTYTLAYTTAGAYAGGVLAPDGHIHFVPRAAARGQKITPAGVASTYSLVYTTTQAYIGGVVSPNGEIHFIPSNATLGQKVSISGVASTYPLTLPGTMNGGILTSGGDILIIPAGGTVVKRSLTGAVSTFSLLYSVTNGYFGGVLDRNGDIHLVPSAGARGQKITTGLGKPLGTGVYLSPFLNKL